MEWKQSDLVALAMETCAVCSGYGVKSSHNNSLTTCKCVYRGIFRICYERFKMSVQRKESIGRPTLEHTSAVHTRLNWARKHEEFVADFLLVTKRTLNDSEYRIFNYHFLLGADWKLCCRKLNMEKGIFFHALYRIMVKLGRTFVDLEPYGLYPVHEYFHGARGQVTVQPIRELNDRSLSKKVPLRKVA
ncbi:MAG TPA: hypothetical protein VER03_10595 [Bryobacteraceae bacterium]|nr:hypothetical protein [Bryobacteraceae bacterium]